MRESDMSHSTLKNSPLSNKSWSKMMGFPFPLLNSYHIEESIKSCKFLTDSTMCRLLGG